jgi:hypothetical protein
MTKVHFEKERETKNKVRFTEKNDGTPVVGTLYVAKEVAEQFDGDTLVVTIEGE